MVIYSQWGRVVGWSEFAINTFPWFIGLFTLAWVYRLGHDLFSPRIAMTATLLLATSVLFLTYMHSIRRYGLVFLFTAIILWSYWRIALRPRPPGHGTRTALFLGATGLLYSHYICALLLPALALFHLFFVRKERRWWQPVFLLGFAALLTLPQIPDLLGGFQYNLTKERLHEKALAYPEVLALFLRYLSNGLLVIQQPVSTLFALALPLPLLNYTWRSRQRRQSPGESWYLLLTSVLTLLLLLGVNEWMQVLEQRRVRYLSALWAPVVLLISVEIQHVRSLLRPGAVIVLVAIVALTGASDFLNQGELVLYSWPKTPATVAATRTIVAEGSARGLLAVEPDLFRYKNSRSYELYTGAYEGRRVYLEEKLDSGELLARAQGLDLVWLLIRSENEKLLHIHTHIERLKAEGWLHISSWREAGVTLEKLVSPAPFSTARLQFENVATLNPPKELLVRNGMLYFRANLHSEDETVLDHYSLAVHIIDSYTDKRVAQGDVGVGPGKLAQLLGEIDISGLPPGNYEVRVALYDWQTGARLPARDLETDEVSDMHTLHRFHIN